MRRNSDRVTKATRRSIDKRHTTDRHYIARRAPAAKGRSTSSVAVTPATISFIIFNKKKKTKNINKSSSRYRVQKHSCTAKVPQKGIYILLRDYISSSYISYTRYRLIISLLWGKKCYFVADSQQVLSFSFYFVKSVSSASPQTFAFSNARTYRTQYVELPCSTQLVYE